MTRPALLAALALVTAMTIPAAAADRPLDWSAIDLPSIDGGALPPESLEGHVVLVVNTASFCGYTEQYSGLEALWQEYRDEGFVLLGVPSNDFGQQEPGTAEEIKSFCEVTFGIDFPMLQKQVVTGDAAHAIYRWAREASGGADVPRWNFSKLLIGADGRRLGFWASGTRPDDPVLVEAIEQALAAQ
jgi:glutathione peroxidase